jgi:hypothetical protein
MPNRQRRAATNTFRHGNGKPKIGDLGQLRGAGYEKHVDGVGIEAAVFGHGDPARLHVDGVLDTSPVERSIRKNAPFAGSDGGAEHCAVIASLIEPAS